LSPYEAGGKKELFQAVDSKIAALEQDSIDLLSRLIGFNTSDPPAANCEDAQFWLQRYLIEKMGANSTETFEDFPKDPHLVARFKSSANNGRSIIFNGHMDVAEVRPDEKWRYGPFTPILENGIFYGRGSTDMKGGMTAMLMAIRAVRESGIKLGGDVIFESVVGEEAGEAGTKTCIDRGYRGDFAVISEPTNFRIQGQGGVITCWLTVKSKTTFHDGNRRRMIHAGGGLYGASAIEKMAKLLASVQDLERHWAVMKSDPRMPPGSTTINPSFIHGGRHPAFIADECKLWLTVHLLPSETYSDVQKEIESCLLAACESDPWLKNNPVEFSWGGKSMFRGTGEIFPSAEIDDNADQTLVLKRAHESVFDRSEPVSIMPSVTDAGWFDEAGIPVAIYGPGDLAQAHTVDEFIRWKEITDASRIYAHLLIDWCGTE
jgi:acetylornithine deacetylase/succinyl-diaminopimelate desuccinylase family protein